ncbi:hypothetical protein SCALIN_C18_0007 [Candidatus Scalindua japonica]|uniref:Uncharacterized protein n=1 Tax=Candidatus Scalindua japonica TaxID=1284222 RepID=A0A286TZ97_9BACT|nr:DUF6516 family protein [Candidatus Scalindua japonica]GAX61188.1 hypothetical protein SCALIN_C18_0007 [Candidatus Scalindua japonica]
MNPIIRQHFDTVETCLIESPVIISYEVLRREVASSDGKLRINVFLCDGGTFELFEYVAESDGYIRLLKYSFHWQDTQKKLRRRWDNAPHHPGLPNSPNHIHYEDGVVRGDIDTPDVFFVIREIEEALK